MKCDLNFAHVLVTGIGTPAQTSELLFSDHKEMQNRSFK